MLQTTGESIIRTSPEILLSFDKSMLAIIHGSDTDLSEDSHKNVSASFIQMLLTKYENNIFLGL